VAVARHLVQNRPARQALWATVIASAALFSGMAGAQTAATLVPQLIDPVGAVGLMNERGDVVGSRLVYPCTVPGTCSPVREPVVWTASGRKSLPTVGTLTPTFSAISSNGTIVGTLSDGYVTFKAAVWRVRNGVYSVTEIGNLSLDQSYATGIDAKGRVVGYATTPFVATKPFMWTATGGLVDLTTLGAPAERAFSVSPNGRVLTDFQSFSLDAPSAATLLPPPPVGGSSYFSPNGWNFKVNDQGDLGGFLLTVSQSRYYLFRYQAANQAWQQLSPLGIASGSGLGAGVGRIDAQSNIGATVGSAVFAAGPDGLATNVSDRLSTAYPANALSSVGYFTDQGVFLSHLVVGGVSRAVKLKPVNACVGSCLRVASIQITGAVQPSAADVSCGDVECTVVTAQVTVTDVQGVAQPNVGVKARFMDSYTLDSAISGRTNAQGVATLRQVGRIGMGTVSMMVEGATRTGWVFDQTVGTLTAEVIPR
jgi:probable HAF family extracellular repeat protein